MDIIRQYEFGIESSILNYDSLRNDPSSTSKILPPKISKLKSACFDTIKLVPLGINSREKRLDQLVIKNNFTKNILGHFISFQPSSVVQPGVKSISYFSQFEGKKISSIRFIRLHPFGSSLSDTTMIASKWIEKAGNRLHMNTVKSKLGMQLLFKAGEKLNPLLLAENEKLMRDLSYLEDVSFQVQSDEENPDEVKIVVISKDKFEYAASMSLSSDNSDVELVNENMFGLGHRLNVGMAQKNAYLPQMGFYFSYHINNIFGTFINTALGYSDTYNRKGFDFSLERGLLTSLQKNAGGLSIEKVSKFDHIAPDHPIELDTTVAYLTNDLWFIHAFTNQINQQNKTLITFRYLHQNFIQNSIKNFGQSQFFRNHDFFMGGISLTKRNLYKNNQVYGYGVTEDIPFGHYYELTTALDRSQFGTWPYFGLSLSNAFIDKRGRYYNGRLAMDGYLDNGIIKQGSILISGNFFSNKFFAFGDPCREFIKVEFLGGINRFNEEYLTINGKFGLRDFYASKLKGTKRLTFNFETVRYLKWNFYNFRFTNYLFTDFAFLSNSMKTLFSQNFYAGIGAGLRIFNESLVFKIVDIRFTWFPLTPPDGLSPFGTNLQGLSKSRFEDFLGRKPEGVRYQ
ncbi:MAG: hypothetical protein M0Q53_13645 [Prolixibacteraceae bacterium]|nr:hypothetical protein [Prolixibacteraceae bacterium]